MTIPDWQLPPGVDRGLWDYLHSGEMVGGDEAQMAASPLAAADVAFCEAAFPTPGRLVDLGCGTGRLAAHFAAKGYDCVGVDLSDEMLARAGENARNLSPQPPPLGREGEEDFEAPPFTGEGLGRGSATFVKANLVDAAALPAGPFDYAACLFSTLGMVRGAANRAAVVANAFRLLRPGGRFVLHVHNRRFHLLGRGARLWAVRAGVRAALGDPDAGDLTRPQAYGGAALTLHHFARREAVRLLAAAGFRETKVLPLGLSAGGRLRAAWWLPGVRAYGYLIACERPA